MPENTASSSTRKGRGGRRPSLAPREVVLGLDQLEWGISLFGACIAMVLALVTAIEWARNLPSITTTKFVKGKNCPPAFATHVNTLCEHIVRTTRSQWEVKFFFIFIVALCLLFFTLRRKRAGVACFAVFLGLGLGIGSGLVFFFLGIWLIIRAYRLQRYGVPGLMASNRNAKELGAAKREGRAPVIEGVVLPPTAPATSDVAPRTLTPPSASKRYTPKKPPRKRR